jgi:hypothetical protein
MIQRFPRRWLCVPGAIARATAVARAERARQAIERFSA